jgi:hypothetical protein
MAKAGATGALSWMPDWLPIRVTCMESVDVGDYLVFVGSDCVRKLSPDDTMRHLVALSGGDNGETIEASVEIARRN